MIRKKWEKRPFLPNHSVFKKPCDQGCATPDLKNFGKASKFFKSALDAPITSRIGNIHVLLFSFLRIGSTSNAKEENAHKTGIWAGKTNGGAAFLKEPCPPPLGNHCPTYPVYRFSRRLPRPPSPARYAHALLLAGLGLRRGGWRVPYTRLRWANLIC